MENTVFVALLITFFAGAATLFGAAITFIINKNDVKILALGMSFSAGVMIYLSFMDIMPMAFEQLKHHALEGTFLAEKGAEVFCLIFFFVGVFFAGIIDYFVPEHLDSDMVDAREGGDFLKSQCAKTKRAGIITALALGLHNLPEGFAVFATSMNDVSVGLAVGFAVMLHNVPEGISVALPIYNVTGSKRKAFLLAGLSGFAEPLGAVLAWLIFAPFLTPAFLAGALAFTAGIMIYIALDELLPMAKEYGHEHYGIIGVFAGMAFMAFSALLF